VLEPGSKAKDRKAREPNPELDEREEEEARAIAASSFSLLASAPTETVLYGPGTFRGPVRYLGPGTPVQLYAQYEATMGLRHQQPASLRTFYRIFSSIFGSHLKFREKNEHAKCTLCEGYKLAIKARLSNPDGRRVALNQYVTHLANVWLDRQASTTSIEMGMSCSTLLASGRHALLVLLPLPNPNCHLCLLNTAFVARHPIGQCGPKLFSWANRRRWSGPSKVQDAQGQEQVPCL
jgi:hypothetical protein